MRKQMRIVLLLFLLIVLVLVYRESQRQAQLAQERFNQQYEDAQFKNQWGN